MAVLAGSYQLGKVRGTLLDSDWSQETNKRVDGLNLLLFDHLEPRVFKHRHQNGVFLMAKSE